MAFVDVNTGKKISLSKGYESRTITYDEWRRQQEEKRAAGGTDSHGAASPHLGMTGGAAGDTGEAWTRAAPSQTRVPAPKAASADDIRSRGSRYSGIGPNPAAVPSRPASSAATSRGRASLEPERGYSPGRERASRQYVKPPAGSYQAGKDDYRDTWAQGLTGTERRERKEDVHRQLAELAGQAGQARVDLDTDTLNQINGRMKTLRASIGEQTLGDRVNDTLSGMFSSYGAGVVNAAGTVVDTLGAVNTRNRNYTTSGAVQAARDNIDYYRAQLSTAKTAEERKRLETLIRSNENKLKLIGEQTEFQESQSRNTAGKIHRLADRMQDDSAAAIASAKEGAGAFGQLAVDVGVAGGQMGMDALAAALTGGSALVPMAVRSFGGGAQEARRSGAGLDRQLLYGVGSAALSVGTEKISNIAKPFQKMFGKGAAETIAGSLVKKFGENQTVQLMQRLSKTAAGRIALSAIGEGGEEVVEDVLQPFLKRAAFDPNARFDAGEAGNDFLVGAILGGLGGVPEAVGSIGSKPARNQAETGTGTEVRAPAGVETAPETEGVQGIQSGTVEPIKVGRVTTIKRPYQGQTPVQAPKNAAAVQVASGSVERAQNRINGAKGLEDTPIGEPGGFKATLKKKLQESFHPAKGVAVDGVAFAGKPYLVDINNSVVGKVVSDSRLTAEKLALLDVLPDVVKRGEYVGSGEYTAHGGREKPTIRYDYFETPVSINGQNYIAKFDVEVLPGANNYRTHQVIRIDLEQPEARLAGQLPVPSSGEPGPVEGTRPLNSDPTITQPSDSVKPSDDGLGAADAGSLSSAFERMQAQTDAFHPINEDSARRIMEEQSRAPSEVPVTNPETGKNITKTVSTILNSPLTSPEMTVEIERAVADGKFDYIPVTDRAAVQRAQADITDRGLNRVADEFLTRVDLGQRIRKNDIAAAMECYNQALAAGDKKTAFDLAAAISEAVHDGAQVTQAMNLMNRLTPEGRLLTLRRYVDRLNRGMESRAPGKGAERTADTDAARADFVEQATGFRISGELAENYLLAETDAERSAAWDAITTDLAEQIPSTFLEKANFIRYTSMLLNPTTHVRNILGNGIQAGARTIKNGVGAVIERAAIKDQSQRTKAILTGKEGKALKEFARGQYETDRDAAMGAGKYSDAGAAGIEREIQFKRKAFKGTNPISKGIQAIGDFNSNAMDVEDSWFNKPAYVDSFAQALKAKGVTAAEASSGAKADLVAQARAYAIEEARRATYRNTTALSETLSKLGRYDPNANTVEKGLHFAADAFLPFRRTPANILTTGMDYSPLGILKAAKQGLYDLKRGNATAADVVDSLSAGLTGTGIMALGAYLAAEGLLRVSLGDDDREEAYNKDRGAQKYALQIGGKSYTLDWASPSAMPLLAGASVMESAMDGGSTFEAVMDAMTGISDVVLETSMLSSLNDLISSWSYAKNKVTYVLDRAASGYLGQYVPTAGGKIASTADDTVRKSYVETGTGQVASDVDYFLQGVEKKIPGARNTLQPKVDLWGEDVSNGTLPERVFKNFLSPGYLNTMDNSGIDRELRRLAESVGSSSVYPAAVGKSFTVDGERKELTAEEYTKYARKVGQTRRQLVEELMDSEGYKGLDDRNRAAVIASAYEYAGDLGKMEVSGYVPRSGGVTEGALKSPLPTAVYLLYRNSSDRDGNGSTSETESAQTLMEMDGLTDKERGEAWSAFNNKGETEESRERKEAKNPFTGALAKDYSPEEVVAAWGIFDGKGTKDAPYTQERKKRDLQEELGVSAREANDLFALMKKAAGG